MQLDGANLLLIAHSEPRRHTDQRETVMHGDGACPHPDRPRSRRKVANQVRASIHTQNLHKWASSQGATEQFFCGPTAATAARAEHSPSPAGHSDSLPPPLSCPVLSVTHTPSQVGSLVYVYPAGQSFSRARCTAKTGCQAHERSGAPPTTHPPKRPPTTHVGTVTRPLSRRRLSRRERNERRARTADPVCLVACVRSNSDREKKTAST